MRFLPMLKILQVRRYFPMNKLEQDYYNEFGIYWNTKIVLYCEHCDCCGDIAFGYIWVLSVKLKNGKILELDTNICQLCKDL